METTTPTSDDVTPAENPDQAKPKPSSAEGAPIKGTPVEHGGPKGPEPTRYGDWEKGGRCTDF
ncbi:MAG: DUF1674 domain-containing protein [Alphaproteobacteria bacterium]|nr:DUF1674 domain-containing protein [Alphaproteobacteria bacterium]